MSDFPQPTGLPTGSDALVGAGTLPAATSVSAPVNPAQAPQSLQTQQTPSFPAPAAQPSAVQPGAQVVSLADYNAMQAHYEKRVSALMSEKDRALNERNQSIAAQAEMQQQYATLQSSAQNGLATSTQAAQTLLDQNRQLQAQNAQLQGQVLRSQALSEHPELLAYSEFIPASSNADEIKKSIDRLTEIRNRDLQSRGFTPSSVGVPQQPYAPGMYGGAGAPQQQQQGASSPFPSSPSPIASLYPNRPTLPLSIQAVQAQQIGSNPAMLSPGGAASGLDAISKLLSDAMASGDEHKYSAALDQAKAMSDALTQQQMGGGL